MVVAVCILSGLTSDVRTRQCTSVIDNKKGGQIYSGLTPRSFNGSCFVHTARVKSIDLASSAPAPCDPRVLEQTMALTSGYAADCSSSFAVDVLRT